MKGLNKAVLGCAAGGLLLAAAGAPAQDLARGRLLHENHCRMCHESIAYKRGEHIARNVAEVQAQVTRWQTNTGLRWSPEDIDNVTAYVVDRYYQFPPDRAKP